MEEKGNRGEELVRHWRCVVAANGTRLHFFTRKPTFSLIGSWLLVGLGVFGSITMVVLAVGKVMEGAEFQPLHLITPLWGVPFMVLGVMYVRILQRRWGEVEIDERSIVWRQGGREMGRWSLEDCERIGHQHAFLSTYRRLFRTESWVVAEMRDGTEVTLFLGTGRERQRVQDVLVNIPLPG